MDKVKFSLNFNKFKTVSNLESKSFFASIASRDYDEQTKQGFANTSLLGNGEGII